MAKKDKKIKDKEKKGLTHVEVILSFVIFMGFIFFLLPLFSSLFQEKQDKNVYLDSLERNIISNVSTNLSFFSIKVNKNLEGESCFKLDYENEDISNIVVENEEGRIIEANSKKEGEKYEISINSNKDFFYVYSSEEFEENNFVDGCEKLKEENFSLSLWRSYSVASNKSLYKLKENYENNYPDLKKFLDVPESEDFVFLVRDTKGNENIYDIGFKKPDEVSVAARNIPIQIVYGNGSLRYAILNLQIW